MVGANLQVVVSIFYEYSVIEDCGVIMYTVHGYYGDNNVKYD